MSIPARYHIPLLLLACFLVFFLHLDVLYANIMEARNFTTAREMLRNGHWIFTTMNGAARYEKPPLPTWLAAISGGLFGIEKLWALRLPSAFISTFSALFFYRSVAYASKNKEQAFNASLILITSFYILFSGRNGTWDIFAHAFMLAGIYYLLQFFAQAEKKYANALLAGMFIGFSFMSKGPVSHFALLFPFLIAYGAVYRFGNFSKKIIPLLLMLVVILVLSSWWAIAIYVFDTHSATAIANKEATAWASHNTRAFYYYWSFVTQSGVWTIPAFVGLLYPYLKSRVENLTAYRFSLWWTLAAVILLSLIPEKKSRYLLPVLIPLAMNTSFYISYLFKKFTDLRDKKETWPVYFNFGLIGFIALAAPFAGYFLLRENLNGLWGWFIPFSAVSIGIGIYLFFSLGRKRIRRTFYTTVFFICAIVALGFPLIRATYSNTDYATPEPEVNALAKKGIPQYVFNNGSPELLWDLGRTMPTIEKPEGLNLPQGEKFAIWINLNDQQLFLETFKSYNIITKKMMDGNITSKADRNYKERRVAYVYILQKPN